MFEISDFYHYCRENRVDVIPYDRCPRAGAAIRDGEDFAIFLDFSKIRSVRLLRGVCCHELAHIATGSLHKVDSPFELAERSEYKAHRWAAEHYLTEAMFREAFRAGYTQPWQLADYFDLPERDVVTAYRFWTEAKGVNFSE